MPGKQRDGGGAEDSAPVPSLESDGSMDGRYAAMEDFLAAVEEKNPQKMLESLCNFIELHEMHEEPEESEGE